MQQPTCEKTREAVADPLRPIRDQIQRIAERLAELERRVDRLEGTDDGVTLPPNEGRTKCDD